MPTGKKLRGIDSKGRGGGRIVHVSKKIHFLNGYTQVECENSDLTEFKYLIRMLFYLTSTSNLRSEITKNEELR